MSEKIKLANSLKLKAGIKTHFIPKYNGVWIHTPNPNPWKIGIIDNTLSFSFRQPHASILCNAKALKFKLDSWIPFGKPLVPPL